MSQLDTEDFAPVDHSGNGSSTAPTDRLAATPHRWPWLLVGAAFGVASVYAVQAMTAGDGDDANSIQEAVDLTTVQVGSQDLVEEVEWSGRLSSGLAVELPSPASGIVTATADAGDAIERGDVVADIDGEPIVALLGSVPMWRTLDTEAEGDDVLQLEINLVALGFDPDGEVIVDEVYDSDTSAMVERWEESLGLETTGEVAPERIVVLPGPAEMVDTPIVGETLQPGQPLAQVDVPAEVIDVVGVTLDDEAAGEVTSIAGAGTPVEHGTVLVRIDGGRVVAVVDEDPETDAVLDAFAEGDVEVIEETLLFLGHDPNREMTIDDEADAATSQAVRRWQEAVGLPSTGSVSPSDYLLLPEAGVAPFVVETVLVEEGDAIGNGALLMQLSSPTLTVDADVAVREIDEFAVGDPVTVEQLDATTFEAVVSEIADVADEPADTPDAEPTISVSFDVVAEPDQFVSGAVTVITEAGRVENAMVVPTRALVTLREGGFAVERQLPDGTAELVGIELGTFDDGVVEITEVTSGSLSVGDDVVVPS